MVPEDQHHPLALGYGLTRTRAWLDNYLHGRRPMLHAPHQHELAQLSIERNTVVSEASRLVAVIPIESVAYGNGATGYLQEIADRDDELIDRRNVVE